MNNGVYLELFHGRADPKEQLDTWGKPGPVFGPLRFVHTTYACHIKLGTDADNLQELMVVEDMVYYDGIWYGDWSVFPALTFKTESSLQPRHQAFDEQKAVIPDHFQRRSKHE